MKTSSAKAKGRRLAAAVKYALLQRAESLQSDDIIVTPSGVPGEDLTLSPAARTVYPLNIECKNQEALNIWAALEQAKSNRSGNNKPIVVFSRNRSDINVALKLQDFLDLIKK